MNDKSNPTLEEMASEISEMEKQLDMKKRIEKKYEGLKILWMLESRQTKLLMKS